MRRFTENREFKPLKMRAESKLAADLCQWTLNIVKLAKLVF